MDGFGYPIDVYKRAVFLGTLEVFPEGVTIFLVQTPLTNIIVKKSPANMFKSQELAAQALHRLWQVERMPKTDTAAPYNNGDYKANHHATRKLLPEPGHPPFPAQR